MAITLSLPPRVIQTDAMSCWAAAFDSWATAIGLTPHPNQATLMEFFSQINNYVHPDRSASPLGIRSIGHLGFMDMEFVRGNQLTPAFFEKRLRRNGHIYLAYRPLTLTPGLPGGHVVVVYGVTANHILVMDPDSSVLFPCHAPFSWFTSKTDAYVGTSRVGDLRNIRNPFLGINGRN